MAENPGGGNMHVQVVDPSAGMPAMANMLTRLVPHLFENPKCALIALMSILRIYVGLYIHAEVAEGKPARPIDEVFDELWASSDSFMNDMLADVKKPRDQAASTVAVPSPTGEPLSKAVTDKMFASLKDKLAS